MKKLSVVSKRDEGLGVPTIMDRDLAKKYGAAYVRLAVYAIDIDRIFHAVEDNWRPFGWEVFVTEHAMLTMIDIADSLQRTLVEDTVISIMETSEEVPAFGSQLPFAVYDAIHRGTWPDDMYKLFDTWQKPPRELLSSLRRLWTDSVPYASALARECLIIDIDPPLAEPTTAVLLDQVNAVNTR